MPEDHAMLRAIEVGSEIAPRWRFRGTTPGPEQWLQSTWSNALAQFIIAAADSGRPVGLVALYDTDFRDGVGSIAATKFSLDDRSLLVICGTLLFLEYVFSNWRLRKLYFDVPEFNLDQFDSALRDALEVEGRLKEHLYAAGRYWDRYTLALTRERWQTLEKRFRSLIR